MSAGAVHETEAVPLPAVAVTPEGLVGTVVGITDVGPPNRFTAAFASSETPLTAEPAHVTDRS